MKKVFVGLSGGVDSSVTAALLKDQGYDVTGVYMKNWARDLPGHPCPWKQDFADAKRVAVQLGIPFKWFDFQKDYFDKVVQYMIDGYKAGITPNPDIMCNQEVKFKLFLETCLEEGADLIATGHYARVNDGKLLMGVDKNKDQSYFLARVTEEALQKTLMPVGEYKKPEVRKLAQKYGLVTAKKPDSQGICFVGEIGIKEFLQNFVKGRSGKIIDQHGNEVGEHDGAIFYTIGQRHGLKVGGGMPFYVTGKDMKKNQVFVTTNLDDPDLWKNEIKIAETHWINKPPKVGTKYQVRTRYRADLVIATIGSLSGKQATLKLKDKVRAVTPGQSAVLYEGERVVGSGIII